MKKTMQNKSIAQQCKPILLTTHYLLFMLKISQGDF